MTRKKYFEAMHVICHHIYEKYGDRESFTKEEVADIVANFLLQFPTVFNINDDAYNAAIPKIQDRLLFIIKRSNSIDELLVSLSLLALHKSKVTSIFFGLKLILLNFPRPLEITPYKNIYKLEI